MERTSPNKILVVDDDPDLQELFGLYLRAEHHEVVAATDGTSAISVARREAPDLILLDIGLPAGDGLTVLGRMKTMAGLRDIPVIVVTAQNEHRNAVFETHAIDFLHKPVDRRTLIAAVRDGLGLDRVAEVCPTCGRGPDTGPPARPVRDTARVARSRSHQSTADSPGARRITVRIDGKLRALIAPFLRRRHDDVSNLVAALERQDYPIVKTLGHRMNGNGQSLGFPPISEIGAHLEQAAVTGNGATIAEQIARLEAYLDRIDVVYV